jgi:hypothetical protein
MSEDFTISVTVSPTAEQLRRLRPILRRAKWRARWWRFKEAIARLLKN